MILTQKQLGYDDVVIKPIYSTVKSRKDVNLVREYQFRNGHTLKSAGIIASNMPAIGTFPMLGRLSQYNCLTALNKYSDYDKVLEFIKNGLITNNNAFITIGESDRDIEFLLTLATDLERETRLGRNNIDLDQYMLCVDVANGYRQSFLDYLQRIRKVFGGVIMAGNVCTAEGAEQLFIAGADIAKIIIGAGKMCTTRAITGVGCGTITAIDECAKVAKDWDYRYICADGGIKNSGDVCKAFCAGADFVMIGSLFAGTSQCEGEWIEDEILGSPRRLKFYGSSSKESMKEHGGEEKDYRTAEGVCAEIPYKGDAGAVIKEIFGGLRSCGTYIGAKSVEDFSSHAVFSLV